jgi:hypothetical protein
VVGTRARHKWRCAPCSRLGLKCEFTSGEKRRSSSPSADTCDVNVRDGLWRSIGQLEGCATSIENTLADWEDNDESSRYIVKSLSRSSVDLRARIEEMKETMKTMR